jgi:hypothetical protein
MLIITSEIFKPGVIAAYPVFTLEHANIASSLESVLKVNDEVKVSKERYSFSFDINGIEGR